MRFCKLCGAIMDKHINAAGDVIFKCRCLYAVQGAPEDTLMHDQFMESEEIALKHEVFIENSPYDNAKNIVMRDCPNCRLNYLTMIRVGIAETTVYTCSCGYRATHLALTQHTQ